MAKLIWKIRFSKRVASGLFIEARFYDCHERPSIKKLPPTLFSLKFIDSLSTLSLTHSHTHTLYLSHSISLSLSFSLCRVVQTVLSIAKLEGGRAWKIIAVTLFFTHPSNFNSIDATCVFPDIRKIIISLFYFFLKNHLSPITVREIDLPLFWGLWRHRRRRKKNVSVYFFSCQAPGWGIKFHFEKL